MFTAAVIGGLGSLTGGVIGAIYIEGSFFLLPADWRFFRGHFDDFPVLAGVVQLNEIVMREVRACWPEHRHLRRVMGLKFRKPIGPGDALELELERTAAGHVRFELRRGAAVATSGVFEFAGAERER